MSARSATSAPADFPYLRLMIDKGYEVTVNARVGASRICAISRGDQVIGMFYKGRMRASAVLAKLDEIAQAYWLEDKITDEVNT
jgi:hypothetical protein